MAKRSYSEINLHITWHTKDNLPFITAALEPALYAFLKNRIIETPGAYFHGIGGVADHLHIATSIRPKINIDEWIGQLKGASSHEMGKSLQWQRGYGVVSFGSRDLKWVLDYVNNQKQHHQKGKIYERLERIEEYDD